jgi:hypothetical protein
MNKEWGFVIDLSIMCMTDFLNLSRYFSQMRVIVISKDMLTHTTTVTGVMNIHMP